MLTKQQKAEAIRWLMCGLLVLADTAVFAAVWGGCYSEKMSHPFYERGNYLVIALFLVAYTVFAHLYGGFDLVFSQKSELIYSQLIAALINSGFMYVIIWLLIRELPNILPLFLLSAAEFLLSLVWINPTKRAISRLFPPKRTFLIYHPAARKSGEGIIRDLPWRFELAGETDISVGVEDAIGQMRASAAESVMLCGVDPCCRNDIVKYCVEHDIVAYIQPNIGDFFVNSSRTVHLNNLPVLLCDHSTQPVWYLAVKRAMDIVLSLCALIVLSPFMLLTAAAIKLYDRGPVLYKQIRLTKDRRKFYVYKFRSMRVDAEEDGVARLAAKDDDRITPVGRVIRMVRLDETPQLFNILRGDMTIVGPRPERPEIAEQYETELPEFALRLQVKAGLTGYAQVYGQYNTTPYYKLQMDLMYIANMGLVTDLKIIFATVKVLFMPESTEGVQVGQTTAMGDVTQHDWGKSAGIDQNAQETERFTRTG